MLLAVLMYVAVGEDPAACEILMSLPPPPMMSEAPQPSSQPAADLCSEPDDPRCQVQRGDVPPSSPLPRASEAFAEVSVAASSLTAIPARSSFTHSAAIDSGVVTSLFRPPR